MEVKKITVIRTIFIVVFFILAGYFYHSKIKYIVVSGESMLPTYQPYQVLMATTNFKELNRGDVVLVKTNNEYLIKRITHVEGDIIWQYYIKELRIWQTVDLTTSYAKTFQKFLAKYQKTQRQYKVPKGFIFIEGDNPSGSVDSRVFGAIPASETRALVVSL